MLLKIFCKVSIPALALLLTWGLYDHATGQEPHTSTAPSQKALQQRIDFGNAYIMGQSIKSGAVYLLHRKQSNIKSMLQIRTDYREEIKEDYALEGTQLVTAVTKVPEKSLK
jgi:hypothetical protein